MTIRYGTLMTAPRSLTSGLMICAQGLRAVTTHDGVLVPYEKVLGPYEEYVTVLDVLSSRDDADDPVRVSAGTQEATRFLYSQLNGGFVLVLVSDDSEMGVGADRCSRWIGIHVNTPVTVFAPEGLIR